ncbi:MAG: T9SS type A sorting domain-containing protein [Euryarchaeota archaeon]|nr:T9SS type A sorting domain-containing protein [Euryarchaeota archaeon]
MDKGVALIIIGVVIIAASLGVAYYMMSQGINEVVKNAKTVDLAPHTSKNVTETLDGNMDYFLIMNSTTSNVSYKVIDPAGKVISTGQVPNSGSDNTVKFKTTTSGTYHVEFSNNGNTSATVSYVITDKNVINGILTSIGALGVCGIGVIVVIVGIILAIKNRK